MNKEFIPYEQALELKELGFDEPCLAFYNGKFLESTDYDFDNGTSKDIGLCIVAPLYQQSFRWFREKYELRISNYRCSIKKEGGIVIGDGFRIFKYGKDTISTIEKETYEEAEFTCLKKLIEIAKQ
jgi:hypothetical protein